MLTRGQRCVVALGTVFLLLIWGVGSESGGEERHAKGHFLQDLEAPLVESLDVGSGTEVPHDMDCSKNNEIFPGRVGRSNASRFRWLPEKCNLHAFSSREVEQCLKHVKVTILGDSLMRELSVNTLGLLHGVPKNLTMKAKEFDAHHSPRYYQGFEFFWAPALNEEPPHKQAMFRDHPLTRASVASADYVVLNSGMWDMGIYHCGVEAFYKKVGDWIGKVKGWMKPGAKFVVVPPHWLNTDATPKCAKTSPCFLCNHHKKVPVFREALSLAAACHNVPVLDMVHVPRTTPHDSRDGIHYDSNVRYMFADILLAYICRGMQPMPLTRCSYVTTHLAAWNAIPEAHVPCQTAPAMFARAEGAKQCHASIALAMNERNFEGLKKHLGHRVVYVSQKGNERPAEVKGAVRVINEVKSDIEMLDTGSRPLFNFSNVVVADQGVLDEEGVVLKSQLFVFTTPSSGFPGALIRAGNVHDEYEYSHSTDGWHLVSRHLQYDE